MKKQVRGQSSVELVIILAATLFILALVVALSTEQMSDVTVARMKAEARATVSDLAATADSVYSQGYGARQHVFVRMPGSFDPENTFIENHVISIRVRGTDVFATTAAPVAGTLPSTPGGKWVWVTSSYNGTVVIG